MDLVMDIELTICVSCVSTRYTYKIHIIIIYMYMCCVSCVSTRTSKSIFAACRSLHFSFCFSTPGHRLGHRLIEFYLVSEPDHSPVLITTNYQSKKLTQHMAPELKHLHLGRRDQRAKKTLYSFHWQRHCVLALTKKVSLESENFCHIDPLLNALLHCMA